MGKLIEGACAGTAERCLGRHILAIQDSSEINLQSHAGRVRGLGTVGNGTDLGFFVHPLLAVDAEDGACLGLAHLHLWKRTQSQSVDYRKRPVEQKESGRWIDTAAAGKQRLAQAAMTTVIADREADIYELWDRIPDERTHLLIRACRDRNLATDTDRSLFDWMGSLTIADSYQIDLQATSRRRARRALLHVRFGRVTIERPQRCTDKNAARELTLNAIEVVEDPTTVPQQEKPIHWRLLTTHPVECLSQARQCIDWYCKRWNIEQLFRTIKRRGLNIESSELEHGERIEKLAVMALSAAVRVMQLTMARENMTARPASDVFGSEEIQVLQSLLQQLEGKTQKQKNPHAPHSLAWAAWVIARLGGWKGYASERKPGPITMIHGLQSFAGIRQGWLLGRDAGGKDLCIR